MWWWCCSVGLWDSANKYSTVGTRFITARNIYFWEDYVKCSVCWIVSLFHGLCLTITMDESLLNKYLTLHSTHFTIQYSEKENLSILNSTIKSWFSPFFDICCGFMTVIKVVGISHLFDFPVTLISKILSVKFCNFDKAIFSFNLKFSLFFLLMLYKYIHPYPSHHFIYYSGASV